jgi:hemolysin activation/secretion protein
MRRMLLAAAFGLAFVPSAARAQAATPARAIDEGLRRQEERAQELRQRVQPRADVLTALPDAAVSTMLPAEQPCFIIRGVELKGPDAVRFGWLADSALPYLQQCAGVAGLRQIAAALDAKLIALGYVTSRVTLPRQSLNDGVLTIQLHVGRVAQLAMFSSGKPDSAWGTWRNAFPVSTGDVLNVRDLEQGVEQMKRLPSQAVRTELEPGAQADTSNIRILREAAPFGERIRGGVTLDNSGSRTLGTTQLAGQVALDNPLGLSDIVSLSASSNAEHPGSAHRGQSLAFNYSVPWGYNTFSFSRSDSRYAQVVQGTTVQFLSSGASESAEVKWHRTMVRTSAAKAGLYAAVATRRANSFLDDVELIVQRRRTTSLEAGITLRQLLGEASVEFELGYRQEDLPTAADGGVTLRPKVTLLSAAYNRPFRLAGTPVQYAASLRAQATHDATLSIDQIAIGNRYSVRGFDGDSVLLAESGYYLRNEFSTPCKLAAGLDSVAYAGIDVGRVWGPGTAILPGQKLAGAVLGMRGLWQHLQLDVAVGLPLYKPEGFRTRPWSPYLSLTYAF